MLKHVAASVVVSTYNHEKFIATAIESILAQDVKHLEVIVVDDGSSDRTWEIVQGFASRGIVPLTKHNGGPSTAVNLGIDHARGDIIVIFSGDDVMLPRSIEARVQALSHPSVHLVSSAPIWIGETGRRLDRSEYTDPFVAPRETDPLAVFRALLFHGNFICAPAVAFTRECWEKVGRFDESLWQLQDYDYWLRASAQGFRFHVLQQPMIKYRSHPNNLSMSNEKRLNSELDTVMARAALLLGQEDLQEIVFGTGFRKLDLGLSPRQLAPFLTLKNPRPGVRALGRQQLNSVVEDDDTLQILAAKLA